MGPKLRYPTVHTITYYMTVFVVRSASLLQTLGMFKLPPGCLSFGPIEKDLMFFVTSACARRTGAAACAT